MGRKRKRHKKRSEQPAATLPVASDAAPVSVAQASAPVSVGPAPAPTVGVEPAPAPVSVDPPSAPQTGAASPATPTPAPSVAPATPTPQVPALPVGRPKDDLIVEDLDADLDEGGDYASLVAAVADIEDEPAPSGRPTAGNRRPPSGRSPATEVEEVEVVHDLDADDGQVTSANRLIAQVGRGAPAQVAKAEPEEDIPVIDLDDPVDAPPARIRNIPAAGQIAPEIARLAQAAAAGRADDADPRPISLDYAEVSSPEARARLLAEALAHAEHKEARYRVPLEDSRRLARWKGVAASVVLVLAGVVAVAPPGWVRPEPPAQLTEGARARGIRLALLLQAQQVEAYRVRTQQLPETLEDLPGALPGVRYARSGSRSYQLVAFGPDGDPIVYDSADPSPAFRVLSGALASAEGGP